MTSVQGMGCSQRNKSVGRAESLNLQSSSIARVPLLPSAADKEFRPPEGKKRGTTYSKSQYVAYGMLRADAPGP